MPDVNIVPHASMQGLAWDVLREVHQSNCEHFIFHAFSNGGCFLWEQVRRILELPAQSPTSEEIGEESLKTIDDLRTRTAGVIFDSCPSIQLGKVGYALRYCSLPDRLEVMTKFGIDVAFFPEFLSQSKLELSTIRSNAYFQSLKEDPWDISQLYLYSESDILIPHQFLDSLVDRREELIGRDRILSKKWKSSRHCAHLLDNPEEYTTIIESFSERCLLEEPKSRL
jgi:hypothetical protein